MKARILIILLAVLLLLLPVQAFAQDCNTVTSGTVSNGFAEMNGVQKLVRWLDGTLWTAVVKDYGLTSQVFVYYSIDNGLNWIWSYNTGEGNDGAWKPTLSVASNYDLCLLYLADNGATYDVKGAMYDAGLDVWTPDGVIYSTGNTYKVSIDIDSNDTFHAAFFLYGGESFSDVWYMNRSYLGNGIWGSWANLHEVETWADLGGTNIAVSQEDDIGIVYTGDTNDVYASIYDESLDSWSELKVVDGTGSTYWHDPTIMATIRGGVTYWVAAFMRRLTPPGIDTIYVSEKTGAGAWSAAVSADIGHTGTFSGGFASLAQEQGAAGTTDTGNWFVFYNDPSGSIEYNEYEVGTGFLGVDTVSCNTNLVHGVYATKSLYPYNSEVGWHWNLQADDFAMTYYDDGADSGYDDGDELVRYWDSASSWGSFRPMVETLEPTNITATTATFNGEILMTGGANPTEIGWQYGHTQTATWTESQSGNFTVGSYYANIIELESDAVYYVRFYATNVIGTSYGDWIGFMTGGEGEGGEWGTGNTTPTVVTYPATNIGATGARINGYLADDGGEYCAVRFQWMENGGAAWTETGWQSGRTTGDYFYSTLTGLTINTTYDFRAVAMNSLGNGTGATLQFTTSASVGNVSQDTFLAIPRIDSPAIDIKWAKPDGATEVMIRGKIGSYPGNVTDGTLVCQTSNNACTHEGLIAGDTWWYSAWGVSGTSYSNTPAHAIATVSLVVDTGEMGAPTGPANWLTDVCYTNLENAPGYGMWNWVGESFGFNLEFWWGALGFIIGLIGFVVGYIASRGNILAGGIVAIIVLGVLVPVGLMAGFIVFLWAFVTGMYAIVQART